MKILSFFFWSWVILVPATAQNEVSLVQYRCETNLQKGKQHDGINSLYFSTIHALFVHDDYPQEDQYVPTPTGVNFVKGDQEGLPVYTNLKEAYLVYKTDYSIKKLFFLFKEPLPNTVWKNIGEEQK
jgi:hypothetical protein